MITVYSNLIFISICHLIPAHLILYYPISSHPILPCLIHPSHFTSSHITLSYPSISFHFIPYYLVLSIHLISLHPILPCLIHPSHFTSSHITLSYPSISSFHLFLHLYHPISFRLVPSHPISSYPISFDLRLFLKIGINECDSMPCLNGGKCVNLNTEDASSGLGSGMATLHKCVCAAGYTGKFCEISNEFVL